MLGALEIKWRWRARQEEAKKPAENPNLIFGGDVHVVWEKFCRYFDVEPRIVPLQDDKYMIGPEDVEPHIDENTIGVAAVLGTTFTGHANDITGINDLLVRIKETREWTSHSTSTAPAAPSSGRSSTPTPNGTSDSSRWLHQCLGAQVRPRLPRHRLADLPQPDDLPDDLVFYEDYLGKRTPPSRSTSQPARRWCWPSTTTSSASAHGLRVPDGDDAENADKLAKSILDIGEFELVGERASSCRWSLSA